MIAVEKLAAKERKLRSLTNFDSSFFNLDEILFMKPESQNLFYSSPEFRSMTGKFSKDGIHVNHFYSVENDLCMLLKEWDKGIQCRIICSRP
jgi:hypothetical protein